MKASKLTEAGVYWCSHDMNWHAPEHKFIPKKWCIVQAIADENRGMELEIWTVGGEYGDPLSEIPAHVDFIGPLPTPPALDGFFIVEYVTLVDGKALRVRSSLVEMPDWAAHLF